MSGLFSFLFLAVIAAFLVAIFKPSLLSKFSKLSQGKNILIFSGLTVLFALLIGATAPRTQIVGVQGESTSNTPTPTQIILPTNTPIPTTIPTLTPVATPTSVPTKIVEPKPTIYIPPPTATPADTGLSNDNYYTNSSGNEVHSPAYSNTVPAGATAICGDGTYSFSQSRRGTCSHHGGVSQWL